MSLSDSLVYSAKPSAVSGHKYRQNLPTYNKASFFPGEVMMLNVPCGRKGQYLNQKMSYLKFKVTNTSVITEAEIAANKQARIAPDVLVSSLIARHKIYHGSDLLKQIHEYGLLSTLWTDITGYGNAHLSTSNGLEGIRRIYAIMLLSGIIVACRANICLPVICPPATCGWRSLWQTTTMESRHH